MDFSTEVRQSVRAAIKAKLMEINAYVDEELPDYIMVLVAKRKTKKQMEEDLSLFLGINTERFTSWLQDVLKKLETIASSDTTKTPKGEKKRKSTKDGKDSKKRKTEQDSKNCETSMDVVNRHPKEDMGDKKKDLSGEEDDDYIALRADFEFDEIAENDGKSEEMNSCDGVKYSSLKAKNKNDQIRNRDEDVSYKQQGLSSTVGLVIQNNSSDDDDDTHMNSAVSSVIKVKERTQLPKEFQPNKNLLLKAMADAQKSTSLKSVSFPNQKTPIFTKRYLKNLKHKSSVQNASADSLKITLNSSDEVKIDESNDSDQSDVNIHLGTNSAIVRPFIQHTIDSPDLKNEFSSEEKEVHVDGRVSPKFTVTLTGVPDSMISVDDEMMEEQSEAEASNENINTRCRYWPTCKLGSECPYVHPTTHCKTFPFCQFGGKCLFIHPSCKFDGHCTRPNCPYTHISKTDSRILNVVATSTPKLEKICKFFPNCTNVECTFTHPKPCKFGAKCKRTDCLFYHAHLPTRKQLKWSAESQK